MTQALRNGYHATGIRLSLKGMVFYKADCLSCAFFFFLFSSFFSQIRCITLRVLVLFRQSCGPLRRHLLTCDWCISIHFVCFCVSRSAACDRPVSHCFGQWSTSFLRSFSWSFLFLSLARIKQCLPPALNKNSTHHRDFLCYCWAV